MLIFFRIFQLYKSVHLLEQRHFLEISDHEMVFNMAPSSKFDAFQFGLHAKNHTVLLLRMPVEHKPNLAAFSSNNDDK